VISILAMVGKKTKLYRVTQIYGRKERDISASIRLKNKRRQGLLCRKTADFQSGGLTMLFTEINSRKKSKIRKSCKL